MPNPQGEAAALTSIGKEAAWGGNWETGYGKIPWEIGGGESQIRAGECLPVSGQ